MLNLNKVSSVKLEPTLKFSKSNWTPYEVKSDWNHIDWKGIENVLSEFNTERIKKMIYNRITLFNKWKLILLKKFKIMPVGSNKATATARNTGANGQVLEVQ
jgi:hypothetical protein